MRIAALILLVVTCLNTGPKDVWPEIHVDPNVKLTFETPQVRTVHE